MGKIGDDLTTTSGFLRRVNEDGDAQGARHILRLEKPRIIPGSSRITNDQDLGRTKDGKTFGPSLFQFRDEVVVFGVSKAVVLIKNDAGDALILELLEVDVADIFDRELRNEQAWSEQDTEDC